jgi:heat shock protein HslJ
MTTRFTCFALACLALVLPAHAQETPRDFPIDRAFKAISISGFDVQKAGITLTVARKSDDDGLHGSGHAGCNSWNANVVVRDGQIDFVNIVTTRKFCGGGRMKTEEAFLRSLRTTSRWRLDGRRLILEGEAARLLMTSDAAASEPAKKPVKKPRRPAKPRN